MALRPLKRSTSSPELFSASILDSLSEAVVVVDASRLIQYANLSAEQFFGVGRARLTTRPHGATVEQIATDLWPHIPDAAAKTTPRQSVSMARQWLGTESGFGM